MTGKNADTKEEIIRIGKELIRTYGFNAFSYADISKQLNIKNAAVHYHFRSKEDLLAGIIDDYMKDYLSLGARLKGSGMNASDKLEQFIERYSRLVESNSICIIGSVAADYNTLPESVKKRIEELVELVLKMVEQTLIAGKRSGEFFFTEPARTQTLLMMTNLAAGVQLARISGKENFATIRKSIVKTLQKK